MTEKTSKGCGVYPYAVVPRPGHYGAGRVRVGSLHRTASAALAAAAKGKAWMAVKWTRNRRWFWSDMPPTAI